MCSTTPSSTCSWVITQEPRGIQAASHVITPARRCYGFSCDAVPATTKSRTALARMALAHGTCAAPVPLDGPPISPRLRQVPAGIAFAAGTGEENAVRTNDHIQLVRSDRAMVVLGAWWLAILVTVASLGVRVWIISRSEHALSTERTRMARQLGRDGKAIERGVAYADQAVAQNPRLSRAQTVHAALLRLRVP